MKIAYTHRRLFINLIPGIFWTCLATFYFFEGDSKLSIYTTAAVGVLFISMSIYAYFNKYIELTNEKIKLNTIPAKVINIDQLIYVDCSDGEYIFRSPDKVLRIGRSQINKKDLPEFESFYNELHSKLTNKTA